MRSKYYFGIGETSKGALLLSLNWPQFEKQEEILSLLRAHLEEELDQMTVDSKASPGLAKSLVVLLSKQHR